MKKRFKILHNIPLDFYEHCGSFDTYEEADEQYEELCKKFPGCRFLLLDEERTACLRASQKPFVDGDEGPSDLLLPADLKIRVEPAG